MSFKRILLLILGMTILSLAYFAFLRNGFNDSLGVVSNLSDSFSVVGIIIFLPSLAAYFDAHKIFYGMRYAWRTILSQDFKDKYKKFSDYLEDKDTEINSMIVQEFLWISAIWIAISVFIALVFGG